jgi:1-acyl-sn-glycerol-3-phosphate acyltransferase
MKRIVDLHPRLLVRLGTRALPAIAGSTALLSGFHLERRLREPTFDVRDRYVRQWTSAMMRALRVETIVDAESARQLRAHSSTPRMIVANHRSTVDVFVLLSLFEGHLLARADMAEWPLMGSLARVGDTLFVDRADPQSGAASIQAIRERLKKGRVVGVFPEGTTYAGDEVRPFHAGAFIAIARERGEIVPVGLAYESDTAAFVQQSVVDHLLALLALRRVRVAIEIGAPVASKGLGVQALATTMQGEVQALVDRARRRLG